MNESTKKPPVEHSWTELPPISLHLIVQKNVLNLSFIYKIYLFLEISLHKQVIFDRVKIEQLKNKFQCKILTIKRRRRLPFGT